MASGLNFGMSTLGNGYGKMYANKIPMRYGTWKIGKCSNPSCDTIGTFWEWENQPYQPHFCIRHNPKVREMKRK